ncbi:hypothetical protein QJS10_CPA03g01282 [Acorus calamus]|uniref:Uncharacterized protein n=1 Tax=Acorus calamus TaxID=4465 RepID=A0AAV9FA01_ACOCL|nr:hypothetical protein QJS10_CPA03g01282 [Acorus calamus]
MGSLALMKNVLRSHSNPLTNRNLFSGRWPRQYGTWRNCTINHSVYHPASYGSCNQARILAPLHRWISSTAVAAASASDHSDDTKISIGPSRSNLDTENVKDSEIAYRGPISSTIKKVKLLSLSTCCLSVSLGPVITFMTAPEMNVILKGAVASSVMFLSASTTVALHWFVSPYIHKLRWKPGSESFEVEMMSWMTTPTRRTIRFADIRPAETNRPFVTFKADGRFYFIDTDHCRNKALLTRLTPKKPSHESAFKNL